MIRVVIDPGVFVSALISSRTSAPVQLIRFWKQGGFQLFVSSRLFAELERVLRRPKFHAYVTDQDVTNYLMLINTLAVHADDPDSNERFTEDPNDDYLVALARVAKVDYLVSGDRHLTGLENPTPPVLAPREFLQRLHDIHPPHKES